MQSQLDKAQNAKKEQAKILKKEKDIQNENKKGRHLKEESQPQKVKQAKKKLEQVKAIKSEDQKPKISRESSKTSDIVVKKHFIGEEKILCKELEIPEIEEKIPIFTAEVFDFIH